MRKRRGGDHAVRETVRLVLVHLAVEERKREEGKGQLELVSLRASIRRAASPESRLSDLRCSTDSTSIKRAGAIASGSKQRSWTDSRLR